MEMVHGTRWWWCVVPRVVDGMDVNTVAAPVVDGGEVDGMDGTTMAALLVGRAELDRDNCWTGERWMGMDGNTVALVVGEWSWIVTWCVVLLSAMDGDTVALLMGRVELDRENVRGAAGRDGWERLRWWWGERSWIGTRCVVLLGGREVDGMDGDT